VLAPEAVEDFGRLSARWRAMVVDALEVHLRHQPGKVSKARIKRLRGMRRPQYRLRVDEVRVFYDIRERTVEILAIVPKSDAVEWLERMGERE
jgi:mRNA-degrading endonuclease RelE of RelBE toxin-antitoxin system